MPLTSLPPPTTTHPPNHASIFLSIFPFPLSPHSPSSIHLSISSTTPVSIFISFLIYPFHVLSPFKKTTQAQKENLFCCAATGYRKGKKGNLIFQLKGKEIITLLSLFLPRGVRVSKIFHDVFKQWIILSYVLTLAGEQAHSDAYMHSYGVILRILVYIFF